MSNRELERKAEVAELLLNAARSLAEGIEPARIYERFHELVGGVIQHDGLLISSYDEREGLIRCDYAWTDGAVLDVSTFPALPLNQKGGGMQSRVILSGEPLLFNDVPERTKQVDGVYYNVDAEGNLEKIPDAGPAATTAAMMVPVKDEDRVVGVVQLMTDTGAYTGDDLELFDGLVAQMGAAVRNARLQQERRRLETAEAAARAVAAEREEAAQVLDAVGDGIFLDDGVAVRLWNKAAALMTGLAAEDVLGRALADVLPDWQALAAKVPVADEGAAARSVTLPFGVRGRDLWFSIVAVRSAAGVVYAFRDVTDERRLEEEKSDFVATISHELRTPMTGVYGAALTLLRTDIHLSAGQREALLQMIATQAARLGQIVDEVLLTRQLDRGEVHVERTPIDVGHVVRSAVETLQAQLLVEQEIEVEVDERARVASGDPDRIQQVLVNLIDNALKYGATPVKVAAQPADARVRISVSDAGTGVPPADRERIFEKFYRARGRPLPTAGGTGLGLYIARELTERMGGRLQLASKPGQGATFVVELRRADRSG